MKTSDDLISREALKEDFKSRLAYCNEWIEKAKDKETKIRASAVKAFISEVIMTINNAPTVEERSYEQGVIDGRDTEFDNGFEQGYAKGYENCEHDNARPQGEWQPISEGNRHECNQCKEYAPSFKDGSEHLSKFCPHCGADMQKGGAE